MSAAKKELVAIFHNNIWQRLLFCQMGDSISTPSQQMWIQESLFTFFYRRHSRVCGWERWLDGNNKGRKLVNQKIFWISRGQRNKRESLAGRMGKTKTRGVSHKNQNTPSEHSYERMLSETVSKCLSGIPFWAGSSGSSNCSSGSIWPD